jgi:hypothetical protein
MMFKLGQMVYIKTDREQIQHQIVSRREYVGGSKTYTLACNGSYIDVYEEEMSIEVDVLRKLEIDVNESTN